MRKLHVLLLLMCCCYLSSTRYLLVNLKEVSDYDDPDEAQDQELEESEESGGIPPSAVSFNTKVCNVGCVTSLQAVTSYMQH